MKDLKHIDTIYMNRWFLDEKNAKYTSLTVECYIKYLHWLQIITNQPFFLEKVKRLDLRRTHLKGESLAVWMCSFPPAPIVERLSWGDDVEGGYPRQRSGDLVTGV